MLSNFLMHTLNAYSCTHAITIGCFNHCFVLEWLKKMQWHFCACVFSGPACGQWSGAVWCDSQHHACSVEAYRRGFWVHDCLCTTKQWNHWWDWGKKSARYVFLGLPPHFRPHYIARPMLEIRDPFILVSDIGLILCLSDSMSYYLT